MGWKDAYLTTVYQNEEWSIFKLKRNSLGKKKKKPAPPLRQHFCFSFWLLALQPSFYQLPSLTKATEKYLHNFKHCGMINTHEMLSHLKFKEQQMEFITLK